MQISEGIKNFLSKRVCIWANEPFTLKQFLQQYKKQKYIRLSDGNRAIIEEGYVRRLERVFKQSKDKKQFKISFFDLPEIESMLEEQMKGDAVFKRCGGVLCL